MESKYLLQKPDIINLYLDYLLINKILIWFRKVKIINVIVILWIIIV